MLAEAQAASDAALRATRALDAEPDPGARQGVPAEVDRETARAKSERRAGARQVCRQLDVRAEKTPIMSSKPGPRRGGGERPLSPIAGLAITF